MSDPTIDQLLPHEIALLNIVAWLAPDPIPRWLLVSTNAETIWHEMVSQHLPAAESTGLLGSSIEGLVRRHVLTETVASDAFYVSGGCRELSRNQQEQPVVWLMVALRLLNSTDPVDELRPDWERLHPHILHATRQGNFHKISEPTSELMSRLSDWLISRSHFEEAEPLQLRALQFDEWNYGSHSLRVARCCKNLALILFAKRRPFEAHLYARRAASIENCFDSDDPLIKERHWKSKDSLEVAMQFSRPEFLSRTVEEVFQGFTPVVQTITQRAVPPRMSDHSNKGEHPSDRVEQKENNPELLESVADAPVEIVDQKPIEQLLLTPPHYPPIEIQGVPRRGRILFAYRCLLRSVEPLDCLGDKRHAVEAVISSVLTALLQEPVVLTPSHFPTRSAIRGLIRDCIQVRKIASLRLELDLSVAIQNVVRFLVSLDYSVGIVRAKEPQTSTRFAERVAGITATTNRHREAQEVDLRVIRNAIEYYGTDENSELPHEVLGKLWPDDIG